MRSARFLLPLALIATSANAEEAADGPAARIVSVIDDVCLPVLKRQVSTTNFDMFDEFVTSKGFHTGISKQHMELFPPGPDATLSQALLVSGEAGGTEFVMAIGGAEDSCRLFAISNEPGPEASETLGQQFAGTDTWVTIEPPPTASPRIAYVKGSLEKPTALAMIFWQNLLPGTSYRLVVSVR